MCGGPNIIRANAERRVHNAGTGWRAGTTDSPASDIDLRL